MPIGFSVDFYGNAYSNLYVGNNGYVTFNSGQGFYPKSGLGLGAGYPGQPIIAAFYGDVDTRPAASAITSWGTGTYAGRPAFGVTWPAAGVGYAYFATDKLNIFQIILTDRSDIRNGDFDIFFNYDQIQWESGDESGGTAGLGGTSAAVGFNAGTGNAPGTFFELPGSLVPGSFLDGGPNSLVSGTNNGVPGQLRFRVRDGQVIAQDDTGPTITITTPPDGATYLLNQSVFADYACEDEAGGSGLVSCDGPVADDEPISTATVGPKTFTVNAADDAENTNTLTHNYGVTYNFTGFFPPVDNLPTLNVAKAGRAVPLKWRLTDARGAPVTTLTNVGVTVSSLSCAIGPTADGVEEYAAGSSGLQNLGDGYYQFNWKTPTSYAGSCKTLRVNLGEGLLHTAAFRFSR